MSARTDLCGGYRAIGIPTAIPIMLLKTNMENFGAGMIPSYL
jgi:hypothetical protein